jgi:hypothetical protein
LASVIRGFAYIKHHVQPWDHLQWTSKDWRKYYADLDSEVLPPDMPQPRGKICPDQYVLQCSTRNGPDSMSIYNGFYILPEWYKTTEFTREFHVWIRVHCIEDCS